MEVNNILNNRYFGAFDVSDDANSGNVSYFAGAPRTVAAGLTLFF